MDLLLKASREQKRWNSGMSDEMVIRIAEFILREIRNYSNTVIETYGVIPLEDTKKGIAEVRRTMNSDFYDAISMGHGVDAIEDFNYRLKARGIAL